MLAEEWNSWRNCTSKLCSKFIISPIVFNNIVNLNITGFWCQQSSYIQLQTNVASYILQCKNSNFIANENIRMMLKLSKVWSLFRKKSQWFCLQRRLFSMSNLRASRLATVWSGLVALWKFHYRRLIFFTSKKCVVQFSVSAAHRGRTASQLLLRSFEWGITHPSYPYTPHLCLGNVAV